MTQLGLAERANVVLNKSRTYDKRERNSQVPVTITVAVDFTGTIEADVSAYALPVGFPFLVIERTEEIVEPVLIFMIERYLSGSQYIANTAKAVAEDLKDWWVYLLEFDSLWEQARPRM